MSTLLTLNMPLNRVEGDLELRIDIADGVVRDARVAGTLFRGFERLLVGRGGLDGLVITPRICGICTTAHLTAASRALDAVARVEVPAGAAAIRNLALMAENTQSDVRHTVHLFGADFTSPAHQARSFHAEAVRRYAPLQGQSAREAVRECKRLLEVVAIIGGQWPHSSFMVPGGIASLPGNADLAQCRLLITQFRRWYERQVLGCSLERWAEVQSEADLDRWLAESTHRDSDLGFFVRASRELGLEQWGRGPGHFLCAGAYPGVDGACLVPAGFSRAGAAPEAFDQGRIAEHVAASWYRDEGGPRHPSEGVTEPYASGNQGERYSFAKAPRYDGLPAETGPLAQAVMARHPLFLALVARGPNAFARQLARIVRPAFTLAAMEKLVSTPIEPDWYRSPGELKEGSGVGLTEAARGMLGHWVRLEKGAIAAYQVIAPTGWNASPRDAAGGRGPMEEALLGTPVKDPQDPVEVGHVVRSFDPCLVCTVHAVGPRGEAGRVRVG